MGILIDYVSAGDQNAYIDFDNGDGTTTRWNMRREPNPAANQDVWRLDQVAVINTADREMTSPPIIQIMCGKNSEQEPVIKESGKSDFCGGWQHGYDELSSISCTIYYWDGSSAVVDLTQSGYVNLDRAAEKVVFSQVETYYEYGTSNPWINATKTWTFAEGTVIQETSMNFLRDSTISIFYTAMLNIYYTIVDQGWRRATDGSWIIFDTFSSNPLPFNVTSGAGAEAVTEAMTYDATRKYFTKVECLEGWGSQQDVANTTYVQASTQHSWLNSTNKPKEYFRQGYTQINTGASLSFKNRYTVKPL